MEIINWKLASHPMNYIIIFLMFFLFALGAHFVRAFLNGKQF